jgi:hypothetical protein
MPASVPVLVNRILARVAPDLGNLPQRQDDFRIDGQTSAYQW